MSQMDALITKHVHPVDTCIICTEPFSSTHNPVALPCTHIFGHACISTWLRSSGSRAGNCPICRYTVFDKPKSGLREEFSVSGIWNTMCQMPPELINVLVQKMWVGIQTLWKKEGSGRFKISDVLETVVVPGLTDAAVLLQGERSAARHRAGTSNANRPNVFLDCRNLLTASWESLGRPERAHGIAVPLLRLAFLMSDASQVLPMWMTTVPRTTKVFWRANACLGLTEEKMNWDFLSEASQGENTRYAPMLHLYTILLSQGIAHNQKPYDWPTRRHEVMNLVFERCVAKIGGLNWVSKPSNEFKDVLVLVYEDLRRMQINKGRASLRGCDGEDNIVKAVWESAWWLKKKESTFAAWGFANAADDD